MINRKIYMMNQMKILKDSWYWISKWGNTISMQF